MSLQYFHFLQRTEPGSFYSAAVVLRFSFFRVFFPNKQPEWNLFLMIHFILHNTPFLHTLALTPGSSALVAWKTDFRSPRRFTSSPSEPETESPLEQTFTFVRMAILLLLLFLL